MADDTAYYRFQLELYQKMGVLCSLFVDPDNPDDFVAGYVAAVNNREAAIYAVSPVGRYDGLLAVRLGMICSVMGEDDYSERLRRTLVLRGDQPRETLTVQPGESIVHAMCRRMQEEDRVISFWVGESEYVGRIRELDDMRVTIGALDFFGQDPLETTLTLRDIDMVSLGSEDDEMFQVLSDNRFLKNE